MPRHITHLFFLPPPQHYGHPPRCRVHLSILMGLGAFHFKLLGWTVHLTYSVLDRGQALAFREGHPLCFIIIYRLLLTKRTYSSKHFAHLSGSGKSGHALCVSKRVAREPVRSREKRTSLKQATRRRRARKRRGAVRRSDWLPRHPSGAPAAITQAATGA